LTGKSRLTLIEEAPLHIREISDLFEIQLEDESAYLELVEEARGVNPNLR